MPKHLELTGSLIGRERQQLILKIGSILLILACLTIGITAKASAATFTVDNLTDQTDRDCAVASKCTLRAAIEKSNATAGPNTVALGTGTYELSQSPIVISNNSVSISGTNGDPARVIIDGKGERAFAISGVNVTFNKLTIQNGKATPDAYGYGGGAIAAKLQAGNVLTLNGSIIQNNTAEDATGAGYGGGLYVTGPAGAKASIVNTYFTSNVAGERGGGMYIEGDLDVQIDQGSFVTNTAKTELGGGLAILAGSPSNSATITIVNSAFNQNKALGSSDDGIGGGLYLNAPATLTGTTFTGNTSNSDGGGMFLTVFDPVKTTGLTNVTFTDNNSTTGKGPGLFIQNGNPVVSNTKFANNLPASIPSIGTNSMPVTPLTPASPMQTSDNKAYTGGSWTTKDVTIATGASIDGGTTWNKGPITISTDGDYTTVYKQEDQLHNAVVSQAVQVKLDKTKPVLSVSLTSGGQSYTDGTWTKDDIIVTAAASDATSGVNARQYSIDGGGTWKTFTDNVAIPIATSGQYALQVRAMDNAGNEELQSYSIKLDKTPPALSMSLTSNGAPYVSDTWATNPVDLGIAASDNDSGLSSTKYSLDNGMTWVDYAAPVSITADGTYNVVVKAVDKLGNTAQLNSTVKIDTTKPTLSVKLISGGSDYTSGTWSKKSVTMDASLTTDSGSGLSLRQYSLNGGVSWTDYNNPLNISADGSYDVQFRATDYAGNTSQQSLNVKIDQTAPSLGALVKTNVGAPYVSDTWATESVTLELQPSDATSGIASVQYSLDNGAVWNGYSNPVTVTDGVYNVKARTTDNAGNETLASWIIKVDTVAPELYVTMALLDSQAYTSDTWVNKPVTFKLSANDNGSSQQPLTPVLRYSLDGGTTWNNYTTGVTVTEGVYSVKAQASDAAGNITEKSVIIKVDQTAPRLAVDMTSNGQPYVSGAWTSQDVTLQVTANDNVNGSGLDATQYSLDGGQTWENYTTPVTLAADGTYHVVIKVADQLGNTSQVNVTVNIDASKPNLSVELKAGDANYMEGTWSKQAVTVKATFVDTVSGLSSKQYSIDGGTSWINYTGAFDLTADGTYNVLIKAVDNAGNISQQSFTVKIDQTAPSLAVDMTSNGQPYVSGAWTSQDVTLQVTAIDNVDGSGLNATQYSLDGGQTWENYTTPVTLAADGTYHVVIKAADQLGNTSQVNVTVNIDASKPNLSVELKAGDANYTEGTWSKQTVTVEATFTDTVSGLSSKQYSIDGGTSWINYTGAFDLTSDGTYDVQVKAINNAGNISQQSFTVKIDRTAPSLAVDMTSNGQPYVNGTWTSQDVTLQVTAIDNVDGSGLNATQYSLDGGQTWENYTTPVTLAADGTYHVVIKAADQLGNTSQVNVTVNIDAVKPDVSVELKTGDANYTEGTWSKQAVTVKATFADTVSGLSSKQYSIDGGTSWINYTGAFDLTDDGTYDVQVRAVNNAGNVTLQSFIVKIDQTAPRLAVDMTSNGQPYVSGAWTSQDVTLQADANDNGSGLSHLRYKLEDEASWSEYSGALTFTEAGHYKMMLQAEDQSGNLATADTTVNISKSAPTVDLVPTSSSLTNGDVGVSVTATVYGQNQGNTVSVAKFAPGDQQAAFFNGGGGQALPVGDLKFNAHDNGMYSVYVQDAAGNETVQKIEITQIVRDVPGLELSFSPSGLTNGQVTVSVTATVYGEEKGNSLQLKWADGIRDAAYFAASGNDLIVSENKASFAVSNNGIYSVYAKDLAGNHSIETIDIQTISRTKPTISLRAVPVDSTYEQFEITVTSAVYGSSNGIDTIKWAPGRLDNTYFEAGSGNVLGKNNPVSFKVTENRDYTVYVKDLLGNSDTQWITVTQINHAPTVSGHTVYGTQDTELTFSPADFPFIDADGDALVQIKLLSLPAYGVLQWNGRAATVNQAVYLADLTNLTYKPQAGWAGEDSFEWNGSDGKTLAAVPAIMKINIRPGTGPVNHPPSAGTVQLTTAMNTTVQGRLIGHDPDGDALTYSMDTQGKLGTFVLLNTTTGDFEYRPIPNATGTDTVTYSVYDIQRASASGTVQVTISPKSVSNRAELTSLSLSTGSLTPAFNAQVFSYNMNVTNAVYATTVTASVYEPRATLMINGISISSGKTSDPIALQQGYNTIVVKVVAEDGKSTNTYTITVYREPIHYPSNPSKGSGSSGTVPAVTDPNADLKGQFNGKTIDDLGTVVTEKVDGQLVATATMDADKVKELLEHAGSKPSFTVVINGDNDRAVLSMDSGTVGMLQNSAATLQLQSNLGNYVLPFSALRMDAIAGQFGPQVNPADLSLKITISKTAAEVVKQAHERAKEGQYSILFPPIDFTVTAVYKDRTSEIHVFSGMVRRELPVPGDVNADRITTAVVVQQDGTVYHVPTRVTNHDGRSFAEISSLTNSTYTVIANAKAFDDMKGHWAQREVNNMASRMIVQGVAAGKYSPDSPVTRAQFAAIVIRALGLSDQGQQAGIYSDVRDQEWYAGVVAQASAFGLVSGYEDGTFRPDRTITREEALVIIARASKLAGQTVNINTADPKAILSGFQDQGEIGDWALREAAQAVQSGLIQGSGDGLKPKSDMTRAETAVILYRLLVKTSLING